jgi:hypothetical protein
VKLIKSGMWNVLELTWSEINEEWYVGLCWS